MSMQIRTVSPSRPTKRRAEMNASEGGFTVRRMARAELGRGIEGASGEGWNPGLPPAEPFSPPDPHGFFLGLLDDEPVACISAVAYDDAFGFIGFFIVRPEFRGRGFGLRIWNAAMSYLGDRTIGLDGVIARQASYQKSGFRLAHRNVRYEGVGGGQAPAGLVGLETVSF